ncbi:hypothetical protein [Mycoavidus sp. B2-EB]|uniref:hypothetical protein n=1 Tax=Mycoavidus sp. B2-EB TaxID=2651972 RepID=UPI00162984A1|nr:hypothetical protein [Mycoavidus sp. B2-EB]BBO59483.1 hypothetical protein MPB2EB_0602 [Mycoavidus sp. B2-EB]
MDTSISPSMVELSRPALERTYRSDPSLAPGADDKAHALSPLLIPFFELSSAKLRKLAISSGFTWNPAQNVLTQGHHVPHLAQRRGMRGNAGSNNGLSAAYAADESPSLFEGINGQVQDAEAVEQFNKAKIEAALKAAGIDPTEFGEIEEVTQIEKMCRMMMMQLFSQLMLALPNGYMAQMTEAVSRDFVQNGLQMGHVSLVPFIRA